MSLALVAGLTLLIALPSRSHGDGLSDLTNAVGKTVQNTVSTVQKVTQPVTQVVQQTTQQVSQTVQQVTAPVQKTVQQVTAPVQQVTAPVQQTVQKAVQNVQHATQPQSDPAPAQPQADPQAQRRAVALPQQRQAQAADPLTDPPMHGTSPHGQGTVLVGDLQPSNDRPVSGSNDTTGADSGEEIVLGRSRGYQNADGTYHGHITVLGLFGNEIIGVDSAPGETHHGPLDALQTQVLDQICDASGKQLCLSVLTADSATTASGSTNHFSLAHATIGGPGGLDIGAAESDGNISGDANCQTATGDSRVANVNAAGGPLATVAQSSSLSTACANGQNTQKNDSQVIGLAGNGIPLPAAGCADGTPDTVGGIPTLLPIVCNAEDTLQAAMPAGVRDALDIFAISAGGTSLLKLSAAASESHAVAPGTPPNCQPVACPNNPGPNNPGGNNNDNNNGGNNNVNQSSNEPECSDGIDNDNDGLVDFPADPGCSSSQDNSEAGGGNNGGGNGNGNGNNNGGGVGNNGANGGGNGGNGQIAPQSLNAGPSGKNLPFTGTNVLALTIAGLFVLGSGLALRRRLTAP